LHVHSILIELVGPIFILRPTQTLMNTIYAIMGPFIKIHYMKNMLKSVDFYIDWY